MASDMHVAAHTHVHVGINAEGVGAAVRHTSAQLLSLQELPFLCGFLSRHVWFMLFPRSNRHFYTIKPFPRKGGHAEGLACRQTLRRASTGDAQLLDVNHVLL